MRKYYFSLRSNLQLLAFASLLFTFSQLNAQVGIGTTNPQATLNVAAQNDDTNVGLIIPSVSNNTNIASLKGTLAFSTATNGLMVVTDDNGSLLNLSSAASQVQTLETSVTVLDSIVTNLSTTNLTDIKIHENDLYFKDPTDQNYWLSASTLTYIFSSKGKTNEQKQLGVGSDGVDDSAGYYVPFSFAIMEITAQDAEGDDDREIRLFLQDNINSSEEGDIIFSDYDVNNIAENWTSSFTRNNSAGRLLAQVRDEGNGRRQGKWKDPIITVEVKKRIQIP